MHTRGESCLVARSGLRFTAVTGARHAVLGGPGVFSICGARDVCDVRTRTSLAADSGIRLLP